jgi:hypothetical protein
LLGLPAFFVGFLPLDWLRIDCSLARSQGEGGERKRGSCEWVMGLTLFVPSSCARPMTTATAASSRCCLSVHPAIHLRIQTSSRGLLGWWGFSGPIESRPIPQPHQGAFALCSFCSVFNAHRGLITTFISGGCKKKSRGHWYSRRAFILFHLQKEKKQRITFF